MVFGFSLSMIVLELFKINLKKKLLHCYVYAYA